MSKTSLNTHRRAMRTVTPAVRAGRATAGAAMAAAMLFGGAAAATAEPSDPQADAPAAPEADAAPAVIAPVTAPAVGLPAVEAGEDDGSEESSFAPAATSISVEVGPTEEEIAAAQAAAEEAAAQEAAEQEAAEQEAAEQEQDQQAPETREDDDSSRSNERDDSESQSSESEQSSDSSGSQESASAPSAAKGSSILATARSGIGTPYVFGGTSPSGWDCSGFVQWVYAQHGVDLPRGANAQGASGTVIPRSEAQPGDLVFKPGHIGIYAGNGQFVDAGNPRVDTSERDIYSGSWTFVRVG
ncbi:hydrolase [Brachybacterium sp. P6-10-X1]|uniref:C40 family peptidase n=1 Tax=Brachybacterium sp. P6-10-X1 TaxID=1903186 RepID=UPI000971B122|nr:C40 family peptidase [Brachybacterium sp. P6-10-X1]APX34348.1 hydrolase [Brachybacterium sp. P6-10-X1]